MRIRADIIFIKPFPPMLLETLFRDARKALDVILSMVDKGQITWATLPPTVKTRMRSILRKCFDWG